ncbi:MAG TPA: DNA methyltransferase [Trebonia sp.]|jgi:hypothetical protein|nr:DNA methyltransferase [Trebonia sp.]
MRALPSFLRKQLETSVLAARRAAEAASRAAIESLGVFADRRPEHLDSAQAALRNGLRAKWRQLGNDRDLLVAECAYEQWHRLLFARFLAENDLLLHPQFPVSVTLAECEELATDLGEPDAWSVAARFAAEILPGIFRLDDPSVRLRLAPEGRYALEQILDAIPVETFSADDALGWVYQFWQKDKKDEVNASERKIGGADLGPVTQLFTENYMVRFLLENSLGAWWVARHPDSQLVKGFEYLRFDDAGKPAAGSFDGWPDRVSEVTVMDPCCGSGHFLVEAFSMLWQMRVEEEGLAPVEAQDAVLRDNLFGLELDPRCVQIAAFALALTAWKANGYRRLPVPNVACSGVPTKGTLQDWLTLAHGDAKVEQALAKLHALFKDADTLGSLIDPVRAARRDDLYDIDYTEVEPLLEIALAHEAADDPAAAVFGHAAAGVAHAATLLSSTYTLIATNPPYLVRGAQAELLRRFCEQLSPDACGDLAVSMLNRCLQLSASEGYVAAVSPSNWLYLGSYESFRRRVLSDESVAMIAWLGAGAFSQISGAVVNVALALIRHGPNNAGIGIKKIDVGSSVAKANSLRSSPIITEVPFDVLGNAANPTARLVPTNIAGGQLLNQFVAVHQGLATGDLARFGRRIWEVGGLDGEWVKWLSGVPSPNMYGGRSNALHWEYGRGQLHAFNEAHKAVRKNTHLRGAHILGRLGVLISQMSIGASLYTGERFDDTTTALVPHDERMLAALWAYCSSPEYVDQVRAIDHSLKVPAATLGKVVFDPERWVAVAEAAGSLPEPFSDDPTQWLFQGRPEASTAPLQVAVARLVGFRWPEQPESDGLDAFADADGIVCLSAVAGEPPAADRVQQLLAAAFGDFWSPPKVKELLEQAGSKRKSLADWLRDEFFKQHCSLFGNRPFVWHIWDGQRDGFSALVNYHRLDRKTLEKLAYTYLGQDWMERQRAEVRDVVAGAEARLAAALGLQKKLEAILEGETPLDIYVRWKEIHEQPIGWEPDLNDGVRLNIRPFVEAGVLRSPFNIHWRKDRGKNPDGTERLNDVHLTLAEKTEARKRVDRA